MNRTQGLILSTAIAMLATVHHQRPARAQSASITPSSFTHLRPDVGQDRVYTIPIRYGSFADVEIAIVSERTTQVKVDVFQRSALLDRGITAAVPRRVLLLSDVLVVENLLDIGSPLVVRIETTEPVSVVLVRRD